MKFYIDTEFNDYKGGLISIALVNKTGDFFYKSLGCENPSPWVSEHVIPFINIQPESKSSVQKSLEAYLSKYDSVEIIADWPEDVQHFCELLITAPGERINTPPLTMIVRRDIDSNTSEIPHNALSDALAIMYACEKS